MKSKPIYSQWEKDPTAKRHIYITEGQCENALVNAGMDTAFYIAGSEIFLWETTKRLREAGIENRRIQQQLTGSAARNVYCVHCQTMNKLVITTIHRCNGCGMALTVRDHFSRPLGAYMGVIVDAEVPGEVPEPEILYR